MRKVLGAASGGSLLGSALIRAIHAVAPISRQAVYITISRSYHCGLLLRAGKFPRFRYSINPKWKRDPLHRTRAPNVRAPRANGQALPYMGPAFGSNPLAPAIGPRPADLEVMPPEIANIVGSLHQRFFRHAHGVVEA